MHASDVVLVISVCHVHIHSKADVRRTIKLANFVCQ